MSGKMSLGASWASHSSVQRYASLMAFLRIPELLCSALLFGRFFYVYAELLALGALGTRLFPLLGVGEMREGSGNVFYVTGGDHEDGLVSAVRVLLVPIQSFLHLHVDHLP